MAKKQKKNLQQLLKKRQQLQNLNNQIAAPTTAAVLPAQPVPPTLPAVEKLPELPVDKSAARHFTKMLVSFIFILIVIAGVVIIDRQQPFLGQLGDWLFQVLRLKG